MRKNIQSKRLLDIYRRLYGRFGPQHWWPGRTRFEIIVGAILTQNTAWTNVEKAIRSLRKAGLLDPDKMEAVHPHVLAWRIRSAGYFNVKAKRLKNFTAFLFRVYGGSLTKMSAQPSDKLRHELLAVNGIGPETADSIMLYAFNKPVFVVDAYTRRIFARHHLFGKDATYHGIQEIFMQGMRPDRQVYNEYHALIVRLGKEFCRTKARCDQCPLRALKHDVRRA